LDAPTLTYNSDDTSIATVSNTGLVTFLKAGATTVLIESAATGSYAEAAPKPVNVAISPASPTISVADAAVKQGEPVAITATLANAYLKSGDSIQFELSGGGLTLPATARANGSFVFNLSAADTKLLGKGIHDLTIRQSGTGGAAATNNTAVSDATFQLTVTENVAPPTPVPTVAPRVITNKAPVITSADRYACPAETGGTFQVSATGKPDKFRYSLDSAPDGVSINATSGLMSVAGTVAADTYTFSVNADNGVNPIAVQNFTLTVEAPAVDPALLNTPSPLRIQGQPKGGSLHVGDVITLNLEGEAEFQTGSKGWTWDSQYFDASFDGSATFTALQTGTTIIRYTAADGQVVSATIDILEKEEPVQPAGPTDDTGVSPWLWVGLAAGLVLIGLVLLWFLIRRRRRQTG